MSAGGARRTNYPSDPSSIGGRGCVQASQKPRSDRQSERSNWNSTDLQSPPSFHKRKKRPGRSPDCNVLHQGTQVIGSELATPCEVRRAEPQIPVRRDAAALLGTPAPYQAICRSYLKTFKAFLLVYKLQRSPRAATSRGRQSGHQDIVDFTARVSRNEGHSRFLSIQCLLLCLRESY